MTEEARARLAQLQVQNVELLAQRAELLATIDELHARLADATAQLAAAAAQLAAAPAYRLVDDRAPVALLSLDAGTHLRSANAAARALLSLAGEVTSHRLDAFVAEASLPDLRLLVTAALAGTPTTAELVLRVDDTHATPTRTAERVLIQATALGPDSLACALVDLTPRVRAEDERRALVQDLHAHETFTSLRTFANGLAHELNNKVLGVTANLELAQLPGAERALLLEEAMAAADEITTLSTQLSAYAGNHPRKQNRVDLADMLRSLETLARLHAEPAHLELTVGPSHTIEGDVAQLSRVVLALVENARDAGATTISLSLTTWQLSSSEIAALHLPYNLAPRSYAVIEIDDNGSGIPEPHHRRVFEPFFSTRSLGRGLGLPVAEGIARRHGGAIVLGSRHGRGTRVRVLL